MTPEDIFYEAELHFSVKNYKKAAESYSKLLESDIPQEEKLKMRGRLIQCLAKLEMHDEARKLASGPLPDADFHSAWVQLYESDSRMKDKEFEKAFEILGNVRCFPQDLATFRKGVALMGMKRYREAYRTFMAVHPAFPEVVLKLPKDSYPVPYEISVENGPFAIGLLALDVISQNPKSDRYAGRWDAETLDLYGLCAYFGGRYAEAADFFSRALGKEQRKDIEFNLAMAYSAIGRTEDARKHLANVNPSLTLEACASPDVLGRMQDVHPVFAGFEKLKPAMDMKNARAKYSYWAVFSEYGENGLKVMALADGRNTAEQIMKNTGVDEDEMARILGTALDHGYIRLNNEEHGSFPDVAANREAVKNKSPPDNGKPLTLQNETSMPSFAPSVSRVDFSQVGGMQEIKDMLNLEIVMPLKNPVLAKKYNKKLNGGYLIYGPPGCGKSFLAEAVAGEARLNLIRASIHSILNMFVGNSEKNMVAVFDEARRNQPALIFFDEIEALGGSRQNMDQHWQKTLVNVFLQEMDRVEKNGEKIFVFGATNAPWEVDSALTRSGRIGREIFISAPDERTRAAILDIYTKNLPAGKISLGRIATLTQGYSAANLKSICEKAANRAWADALKGNERLITLDDFTEAIRSEKSDVSEWVEAAKRTKWDKNPEKQDKERMYG